MATTGDSIPVVDFKDVPTDFTVDMSCYGDLVEQLHTAFKTVGFVFITNHGIEREQVDKAFLCGMSFFEEPLEKKQAFSLRRMGKDDTGYSGYVALERESVDPSKPGDLKECFQLSGVENINLFPSQQLPPNFQPVLINLYNSSILLGKTILHFMGHALKLEDPLFFVKNHQKAGMEGSYTTARLLHYPPVPPSIKPGQLRLGEHVDYGSITLLFQDPTGGLQVKKSGGGYIDVPYRSDAVLVNLGALMQRWTADQYVAAPHRVLIPVDEEKKKRARQSIVIFFHPDYETVIRCLDNSNKYPETTAYEDTSRRLNNTYDKPDPAASSCPP